MQKNNSEIWKNFKIVATPYWFSENKWKARWLVLLLVFLLFIYTGYSVLITHQQGELISSLAAKDPTRFWQAVLAFLGLICFAAPLFAFYTYIRDKLTLNWRKWLTNYLLNKYFSNRSFYRINSCSDIDNPDQRISEDIKIFTQQSIIFLLVIVESILQLIGFSGLLWSISKMLLIFLIIYATIGTAISLGFFGKILLGINLEQLKLEANFRFGLVRIRENAESIAFYNGEQQELFNNNKKFTEVFCNFKRLIRWQFNYTIFHNYYRFATYILPVVIIAPHIFSGELEIGSVTQADMAFARILTALILVVDQLEKLSGFAAGINRLAILITSLEKPREDFSKNGSKIEIVEDFCLTLKNVTLKTPNYQRILVKELSCQVPLNKGLLIQGVSGSGKSSLLRAIAGLWDSGDGIIIRPKLENILFLPQHPYMILGSLRSQLLYPNRKNLISDEELYYVLRKVNLSNLPDRFGGLDAQEDWSSVLSMGEQQRLSFARLLITNPSFAILDEATSALDEPNEENLYKQLQQLSITFISVGHHSSIVKYHSSFLKLKNTGEYV